VLAAAGREIENKLAADPPAAFPFFGMSPDVLRNMCNPQQFQSNIQATLANYGTCIPRTNAQENINSHTAAINKPTMYGQTNRRKMEGGEKTGTSEPGVFDFAVNSYHGEDGDGSACSREEDKETSGKNGKVDPDTELNGSLAKFLSNSNPPQMPATTGWTSQYSDPQGVSNMWHSLGKATTAGVKCAKAEEKNASGEGGSSGNDSVHPNNGNAAPTTGHANNGNGNGTTIGKSGEGSNDKTAIGSNEKKGSGEGSNDKNTSNGVSQNPAHPAPPLVATSAQRPPSNLRMTHAFHTAMNALQSAGFGDLVVGPGMPSVPAMPAGQGVMPMNTAPKSSPLNNSDSATAVQLPFQSRAGVAQDALARRATPGRLLAAGRVNGGSDQSQRSRGTKRSSGSSDCDDREVKKGGRNRKSVPVQSNVS